MPEWLPLPYSTFTRTSNQEVITMSDAVAEYFDREVATYSPGRLDHIIKFLADNATENHALLDVGCGTGNILAEILTRTPIKTVAGLDVSPRCLDRTKQRLGCTTYLGSILDTFYIEQFLPRFEFVLISAVLHHLVSSSRNDSLRHMEHAVQNAFTAVRPEGYLMIFEPGIFPAWASALLYQTKRTVTRFTSKRLQLFDKWNNIGAPVILFLTDIQLRTLLMRSIDGYICESFIDEAPVNKLWRLAGITCRFNMTFIIQKTPGHGLNSLSVNE
jgi:SAM-dependent methyltransferase